MLVILKQKLNCPTSDTTKRRRAVWSRYNPIYCNAILPTETKITEHSIEFTIQWRNNERNGVSNHQRLARLLNGLFRRGSKNKLKLRVTSLCEGNPSVTGEFPSQRASNAGNLLMWWRRRGVALGHWRSVSNMGISRIDPIITGTHWTISLPDRTCKS